MLKQLKIKQADTSLNSSKLGFEFSSNPLIVASIGQRHLVRLGEAHVRQGGGRTRWSPGGGIQARTAKLPERGSPPTGHEKIQYLYGFEDHEKYYKNLNCGIGFH